MSQPAEYLDELVSRTATALDAYVVGVYLHGSAAMGAFVPSRSDVDVLAVTVSALTFATKRALADSLSEAAMPCPGVGLEMSVVTALSAKTPSSAPRYELHIATEEGRVVDGLNEDGDPDLVAHFAMARARGVALLGLSPSQVFTPLDRGLLLRSFAHDLTWGLEHRRSSYSVLNACRALRFATEGGLYSKLEGGEWALEQAIGAIDLIETALRRQRGEETLVDFDRAKVFVSEVRARLLAIA